MCGNFNKGKLLKILNYRKTCEYSKQLKFKCIGPDVVLQFNTLDTITKM